MYLIHPLPTLERRRFIADLFFSYKIINHVIKCPQILQLYRLHIPAKKLRHWSLLYVEHYRTLMGKYNPINRMCMNVNTVSNVFDFFDCSFHTFRTRVISHICNELLFRFTLAVMCFISIRLYCHYIAYYVCNFSNLCFIGLCIYCCILYLSKGFRLNK